MDIQRRTVLQAGGIIAVGGVVAACSSGGSAATASSAAATGEASAAASTAATGGASSAASAGGSAALAQVSDIPVGGGMVLAEPTIVITQPAAGDVKAFSAICTHQGCLVSEVVDNEIICPCHGSKFSALDGSVINGPAQTPLEPAGVAVDGGAVILS